MSSAKKRVTQRRKTRPARTSAADLAALKRDLRQAYDALLALKSSVPDGEKDGYDEACLAAMEARDTVELASFARLVEARKRRLPALRARTARLRRDLEEAGETFAQLQVAAAGIALFADIVELLA
jgi:hypothetical protein